MGTADSAAARDDLRDRILARPDVILDDPDVMRALIEANERAMGSNIVDLRGIAMERLEMRLDRLEDTHRSVIAAAYENLSGTNQIHRAILRMLEPKDFASFVLDLGGEVAEILKVDTVRLALEETTDGTGTALSELPAVLALCEPGFIDTYLTGGKQIPVRKVTLRQTHSGNTVLYGSDGDWIRSEACLKLHFGAGRLPGLLCLGAEDPSIFSPSQGTDLLAFFASAVERALRRWLA